MSILEFVVDHIFPVVGFVFPAVFGSICFLFGASVMLNRIDGLLRLPKAKMVPAKIVGVSRQARAIWVSYDVYIDDAKPVRLKRQMIMTYTDVYDTDVGKQVQVPYDSANKCLFPHKATAISEIIGYFFLMILGVLFLAVIFI